MRLLLFFAIFLCGGVVQSQCGFFWGIPQSNQYGPIDGLGRVSHNIALGEVVFGDDKSLPVFINLWSNRKVESPYFGSFWELPLFESRCYKNAEQGYDVFMPDGYLYSFKAVRGSPGVFEGQLGFLAEEQESGVLVMHPCGSSVLFSDGVISRLGFEDGSSLRFLRNSRSTVVEYCREESSGGGVVFECESDGLNRLMRIKGIGELEVSLVKANSIVGEVNILSQIAIGDEVAVSAEWISSGQEEGFLLDGKPLTWVSGSGEIAAYQDWRYSVLAAGEKVERIWRDGTVDGFDRAEGVSLRRDGYEERKEYFEVRGVLNGKLRAVWERKGDDAERLLSKLWYDGANGRVIRRSDFRYGLQNEMVETVSFYTPEARIFKAEVRVTNVGGGVAVSSREYDLEGRLRREVAGLRVVDYLYFDEVSYICIRDREEVYTLVKRGDKYTFTEGDRLFLSLKENINYQ